MKKKVYGGCHKKQKLCINYAGEDFDRSTGKAGNPAERYICGCFQKYFLKLNLNCVSKINEGLARQGWGEGIWEEGAKTEAMRWQEQAIALVFVTFWKGYGVKHR